MTCLAIATVLVAVITLLEAVDPGIFSTALPLPVLWIALLSSWFVFQKRTGFTQSARTSRRQAPRSGRRETCERVTLTVLVGLSTMVLVVFTVRQVEAVPAALLAGVLAAAVSWAMTGSTYADNILSKDRPR